MKGVREMPLTKEQRAMLYYMHAVEYIEAYTKLADADASLSPVVKDLQQASVKHLVVGHALELTLKGWLILHEGTPVKLTQDEEEALKQAGQHIPKTLKDDYGHDLRKLGVAVVKYYPKLKPYLKETIPMFDAAGAPVLDKQKRHRKKSIIDHLNSSYWAGGAREYEYPEPGETVDKKGSAFLSPLDKFVEFVTNARHELLTAIMAQNGGAIPRLS